MIEKNESMLNYKTILQVDFTKIILKVFLSHLINYSPSIKQTCFYFKMFSFTIPLTILPQFYSSSFVTVF